MRRAAAKRAALRAMEGDAFEIGDRQVVIGDVLVVLRRSRTKDIVDVVRGVLSGTDVAPRLSV
jgi:hypothetical protein